MKEVLVIILGVALGVLPTLYLLWEFAATITQKIYRKIKYGVSLFD